MGAVESGIERLFNESILVFLSILRCLPQVACVFLIACVTSDEAEEKVKDIARSSGLVKPCGENRGTSTPDHVSRPSHVGFCSSTAFTLLLL